MKRLYRLSFLCTLLPATSVFLAQDMSGAIVYQDNLIANGTMRYFYKGILSSGTYI